MMNDVQKLAQLREARQKIEGELAKVIIGQKQVIEELLICLFANAHCVIVGVPGLAKTLLIATLAEIIDLSFNRIQFTPDLMPSDITGGEILEENKATGSREFRFIRGPVFANIVLADEINRTPPKTQSALLQCMQEYKVTLAGQTYPLPKPFFILATQNPIELEGTYPLPEAQLDRFMFLIHIDYPALEEEYEIVQRTAADLSAKPQKVIGASEIVDFQNLIRRVPVADTLVRYTVDLLRQTRPAGPTAPQWIRDSLTWGAGPRAAQHLILAAKTRSALLGRPAPDMEDVRAVAKPVLRHRLILNFNAEAEGLKPDKVVEKLLQP